MYTKVTGQISINCLKLCSCIVDAMKVLGKCTLLTKRNDERWIINREKKKKKIKIYDTIQFERELHAKSNPMELVWCRCNDEEKLC